MNDDRIHPTSLEQLPTEIFFQIFAFLHLHEFTTAFSGLNSNVDAIIKSMSNVNHIIKYDDGNAIHLLQLFAHQITRLVVIYSDTIGFTSLINLRSLVLKHGIAAQFNSIRLEYFPKLEILHIYVGYRDSINEYVKEVNDLFQIILSNGFPQLRLCTAVGIQRLMASEAWLPSPALRSLHLDMKTADDYEQLLSVCPNLRRFTSFGRPWIDPLNAPYLIDARRFVHDLKKLEQPELRNRFVLDVNPMEFSSRNKPPTRFNNTTTTYIDSPQLMNVIRGRIFPQTEPYCRASFLIEIKVPRGYPFKMPTVVFLDPIHHPKVDKEGRQCSCWDVDLWDTWTPAKSLTDLVTSAIHLIDSDPGDHNCCNYEWGQQYRNNYDLFQKTALRMTLSYGRPRY